MRILIAAALGLLAVGVLMAIPSSYASTQTTPLGDGLNLETVTTTMTVPEDNELPWGHVQGSVDNPAEWYPVIIQFYKGEDPVHVAQVDLNGDDTYDYKFRVRNVVDGQAINIFEGDYTVKIFTVVENRPNTI